MTTSLADQINEEASSLLNKDEQNERALVRVLLEYGLKEWEAGRSVADYILNDVFEPELLDDRRLLEIINIYKIWYEEKLEPTEKNFLYYENQETAMFVMSLLDFPYQVSEGWKEHFETPVPTSDEIYKEDVFSSVNYLKLRKIKRLIDINQKDLEQSNLAEEQLTLLQTHKILKDMEMSMTKKLGTVILK